MSTARKQHRVFDVYAYGYPEFFERIANLTADTYDPSDVVVIGNQDDQEWFLREYRKWFGDPREAEKYEGHLLFPRAKGSPVGLVEVSLASEPDTESLINSINTGTWKNPEGEVTKLRVRTVVLVSQPDTKYLSLLLNKCRGTTVYVVDLIEEANPSKGIVPRESVDGYSIELKSQPLTQIRSEAINWLYKGYLPKGMLMTLFAPKGRGKTKICDYFTSILTTGRNWDDGTPNPLGPRRVLRFNLEDPVKQVLKPALHAAGANLDNVEYMEPDVVISSDGETSTTRLDLSDASHVLAVRKKIQETGAALVIVEPLNNYKGQAKSISEDDMRPLYMSLSTVARETGTCILVINHANKKKDVDVLEKSLGAGSGPAVARANWFLERNPDNKDERILTDAGSNLPTGPSLVFKIISAEPFELDGVTHLDVGYAQFLHTDTITGEELLERVQFTQKGNMEAIANFLREFLKGKGEVPVDQVKLAAHNENATWSWDLVKLTFSRRKLGVSRTEGGGKNKKTFWSENTGHGTQALF